MKLGCCGSPDQTTMLKDAGFDFLEVKVQALLQGHLDDKDWSKVVPNIDKLDLPMEAANSSIPRDLPIVGSKRDISALDRYMKRITARSQELGIKLIVFGSGGSRKKPDLMDQVTADKQIAEFCQIAGDACAAHDVLLIIEHEHLDI